MSNQHYPVTYYRVYKDVCKNLAGGVFLSQAVKWTAEATDSDGWFVKTISELEEVLGLTRSEQSTARSKLRAIGVLEESKKGMPYRVHYRINLDKLKIRLAEMGY